MYHYSNCGIPVHLLADDSIYIQRMGILKHKWYKGNVIKLRKRTDKMMKNKNIKKLYDYLLILFTVLSVICIIIGPLENIEILMKVPIFVWAVLAAGKYLMNLMTKDS